LTTILIRQPYLRKGDDRLHLFVQTELFLVVLCGWILWKLEVARLDEGTDILLSIVMIAMTIAIVAIFIIMAVRNVMKMYKTWKRKKDRAADIKAGRVPDEETKDGRTATERSVSEMSSMKKQWIAPM